MHCGTGKHLLLEEPGSETNDNGCIYIMYRQASNP